MAANPAGLLNALTPLSSLPFTEYLLRQGRQHALSVFKQERVSLGAGSELQRRELIAWDSTSCPQVPVTVKLEAVGPHPYETIESKGSSQKHPRSQLLTTNGCFCPFLATLFVHIA